jgi:hypothetical protein
MLIQSAGLSLEHKLPAPIVQHCLALLTPLVASSFVIQHVRVPVPSFVFTNTESPSTAYVPEVTLRIYDQPASGCRRCCPTTQVLPSPAVVTLTTHIGHVTQQLRDQPFKWRTFPVPASSPQAIGDPLDTLQISKAHSGLLQVVGHEHSPGPP